MDTNTPNNSTTQSDTQAAAWRSTLVHASRPVRIAATAALVMLALFLLVSTIDGMHNWGHEDSYGPDTVTVTGTGMATAIPDIATISFSSSATAADVATAQTTMTKSVDAALASVEAEGVSKDDITTSSYNVSPHYSATNCYPGVYCPASNTASGYDVSETISINVKDTTKVSAILGDLAKAKVTNVSGPDFGVGDTQVVMAQARAQAIQKAQTDAQTLAKNLGVKLGKITEFEDNTNNDSGTPEPMMKTEGAMDASAVNPTVPTGSNQYSDTVSITYAIN